MIRLRDRAALGVLAYTGAHIGAVARLRLGDLRDLGEQRALRFREKGGKECEIPLRHDLEGWLSSYIEESGIGEEPKTRPLFRAAEGKRRVLSDRPFSAHLMR